MRVTAKVSPNTLRVALVTALLTSIGALMPTAVTANHVKAGRVAPSITAQPLSQTVTAGQAAVFSVTTTGSTPMSYQWKKNGIAISGATSPTYQTPATALSDNGTQFIVLVSNTAGSATSNAATLTVRAPVVAPSITAQPLSQTVTAGQAAVFSVTTTGSTPMTYQWEKNGIAISGATSSTYQTPSTAPSDNGSQFTVVVSNTVGSVTSNGAILTVNSPGCSVSSGKWVNSNLPLSETSTFRVEFDATPSLAGLDAVMGLSSGPASAYTSLAAIVRFNSTGTIDARNSAAYTAATAIPYAAATTYHFIMDVNITAHTYDAYVVVGGTQLVIGSRLAFRTEQAAVSSLNNLAAIASQGTQTICNVVVSAFAPGCSISSGKWVNSNLPLSETSTFRVEFDATPSLAGLDAVMGLSSGPASAYTSLAAIVRFNSTGTIDARNSAAYTAATAIPYAAATTYHFIMDVNITAHIYDAYVVVGGTQLVIGSRLAFRTEQAAVSPLNNLAAIASQGSQSVCNVVVSAIPMASSITAQPISLLLTASSTQVNFGSVNVSSSASRAVSVTNTGNSNVTISNVVVAGAGFNATGGASGLILSPGQTATVTVTFSPAAAGTLIGSLTIPSNASNSPSTIALSGTGIALAHSVNLSWMVSTSTVVGYNVYSSHASGGPYVKLNPTPIATPNYTDATVQSAQTYYYVATAVATNNSESAFSPEVSAVIP